MKIEEFIESLEAQTTSKETVRAYRQDLERFAAFLTETGLRTSQVKPSTINQYVNYLRENQGRVAGDGLSSATIARRLAVVSRYYEWLGESSARPVRNPVATVRRPKIRNAFPRAVDESTLTVLMEGITDIRDRALVLLFLYSGLRLSELQQLNKQSITLRGRDMPDGSRQYYGTGEVIGKGGKRRQFLVGPKAVVGLSDYLAAERMNDEVPALFISSRGTRLSCRAIQQVIDKWCVRLGVDHIHVHQFRHSFATRNVNAGMSSAVLQQLMGHGSLAITQRYFSIRPERLVREYFATMEFVRDGSPV